MKPKSKATVDLILKNPKISNTEAYLRTHKTTDRNSARASVSKLLAKPNVQIYMDNHVKKAKERIVELVGSKKEEIALKASDSILDRALGKPVTTAHNTSVSINLEQALSDLL